jgi:hypothetical protein
MENLSGEVALGPGTTGQTSNPVSLCLCVFVLGPDWRTASVGRCTQLGAQSRYLYQFSRGKPVYRLAAQIAHSGTRRPFFRDLADLPPRPNTKHTGFLVVLPEVLWIWLNIRAGDCGFFVPKRPPPSQKPTGKGGVEAPHLSPRAFGREGAASNPNDERFPAPDLNHNIHRTSAWLYFGREFETF